jgi:hypothetical protein
MSSSVLADYTLSDDATDIDLRTAEVSSLRYHCFLGDIVLRIDDVDLSTHWGWVPVLDFAVALHAIAHGMDTEPHRVFTFTESDATLEFDRDGDVVNVQASYAPGIAEMPYAEFVEAADAFLRRVVCDLTSTHPELAENPFVAELAPKG